MDFSLYFTWISGFQSGILHKIIASTVKTDYVCFNHRVVTLVVCLSLVTLHKTKHGGSFLVVFLISE